MQRGLVLSVIFKLRTLMFFVRQSNWIVRLQEQFGYDAYYKIIDPCSFSEILYEKINEKTTINYFKSGIIKYVDNKILRTNKDKRITEDTDAFWNFYFAKPKKFKYQKEFRIVFMPAFDKEIYPINISCLDLLKSCKC